MNLVLLSGGSGKRLWPLSNDVRSKQFIPFLKTENGYESMVQRVYRQIKLVDENAEVTIATSKAQVSSIHNQLGEDVGISIEPCRRDTFPAIALAAAYLKDVRGVGLEESVVVLMGIEPTYPSEKYGYIIPTSTQSVSDVSVFKEKPTEEIAKGYIAQGALWNGGVFAFRLGHVLDRAHELIDFTDYADLFDKYETLEKISFDYAVVEHEKNIKVMRFSGAWNDLGTWNALTEIMEGNTIGEAIFDETTENTFVINEMNVPILCMGTKNIVVSASAEGILVSDIEQADRIKPYVDQIDQQIMYAEKSWGSYRVIDIEEESITIKVTLNPGHSMNYHSHEHRDEVWTILSGEGRTIVDGMEQSVRAGDVITMSAGCRHTIIAKTELQVMEVQLGKEINVHDKKVYELPATR